MEKLLPDVKGKNVVATVELSYGIILLKILNDWILSD